VDLLFRSFRINASQTGFAISLFRHFAFCHCEEQSDKAIDTLQFRFLSLRGFIKENFNKMPGEPVTKWFKNSPKGLNINNPR
jgi:hypothetical protein